MEKGTDTATVIDEIANEYLNRAVGVLSRAVDENRIDTLYDHLAEVRRTLEEFRALRRIAEEVKA